MTKLVHVAKGTRRREYLRAYLIACIQDSEIEWLDFAMPTTLVEKTMGVLTRDVKLVLADLGKRGTEGLLQKGAEMLSGMINRRK